MIKNARNRALRLGVPFSLTVDDIVIPETCPVLGIPLVIAGGQSRDCSPSVDRIIPDLGYIPGNIVVMSHRANTLKNNATPDELYSIAKWLEQAEEEVCKKLKK